MTAAEVLAQRQPRPGRPSWLATFTGIQFVGLDPAIDQIRPRDIAYGLAHKYRWAGQSDPAFTVAEHSVLVEQIIKTLWPDEAKQKAGLLHDAVEGWWVDLPAPVRVFAYLHLPSGEVVHWDDMEDRILTVVAERFGLDPVLFNCDEVRAADLLARSLEFRECPNIQAAGSPALLPIPAALDKLRPRGLDPDTAMHRFLLSGRLLNLWSLDEVLG